MAKAERRLDEAAHSGAFSFEKSGDDGLVIRLSGSWSLKGGLPSVADAAERMASATRLSFDARELDAWDTSLLTFLMKFLDLCKKNRIAVDRSGLPSGIRRLLDLAEAVPERKGVRKNKTSDRPVLERIGTTTIATAGETLDTLAFLGELTKAFGRFFTLRARYRAWDLMLFIQECGAEALPIVTLISFLSGVILAFVGAVQLRLFGGQIYIADLVAIGMVREMGAIMTAVIMAGRTGAAFAAQLGTMKVTQEIDAFTAMGFPPMEFLVLPRVIALTAMMPLLCLYSDVVGILGGAAIGVGTLDISWASYYLETTRSIDLAYISVGVIKSVVYGVLIAFFSCLRGMQCGNSSSAVGDATTSAVVSSIVACVVANGILAVVFYVLWI
jgi:phospholipid/cholesterol/gamma-HCH transport system permease protein